MSDAQKPAHRRRSALRRSASRLALLVGATLAALMIGELLVRVAGLEPPAHPSAEGRLIATTGDPDMPRALIPGAVRTHLFPRPDGQPPMRTTTVVNAAGLRGPVRSSGKPEGVLRIACLGDSFTFGRGVDGADTWPARLQAALDQRLGRGRVEVWNFGLEGSDTVEQLGILQKRVLQTEPDLVLLGYYLNDVGVEAGDAVDDPAVGAGAFLRHLVTRRDGAPLEGLRESSRLVDLVAHRIFVAASLGRYAELYTAQYDEGGEGWTRVRAAIRTMHELLVEQETDLMVLTWPMLTRRGDGFGSDEAYRTVHAFCRAEGLASLDLAPFLQGHTVQALRLHDLDQHPSALANMLVADGVAVALIETWEPLRDER